jgi:hypothetical protein
MIPFLPSLLPSFIPFLPVSIPVFFFPSFRPSVLLSASLFPPSATARGFRPSSSSVHPLLPGVGGKEARTDGRKEARDSGWKKGVQGWRECRVEESREEARTQGGEISWEEVRGLEMGGMQLGEEGSKGNWEGVIHVTNSPLFYFFYFIGRCRRIISQLSSATKWG